MKKLLAALLFLVAASGRAQIIDFAYHLTASTYPLANSSSATGTSVGPYSGTPVLGDLLWFNGTNWVSLNKPADGTYSIKFLASTPSYIAAGGSTPTGTGFTHITAGVQDAAAKLVDTADINANQVTLPKLATQAAYTYVGNDTNATTTPTAITNAQALDIVFQDNTSYLIIEEWFTPCASSGTCGTMPWRGVFTNTGNNFEVDDSAGHPGVVQLTTGTNAAGAMMLFAEDSGQTGGLHLGGGAVTIKMNVKFPVLSTSSERYKARLGLLRGPNTVTQGVWFDYDEGTSGNFWRICTEKNSTATCSASTTAVPANTWQRLEIQINAAATSVAFLVDGSAVNVSPLSTNIPDTAGVAPDIEIIKTVGGGATASTMLQDYYRLYQTGLSATR